VSCNHEDIPRPLRIRSDLVPFSRTDAKQSRQGSLRYRGGIELSSRDRDFGGISGLLVSADGDRFIAVSDQAHWITGTLTYNGGDLAGAAGDTIAPLLDPSGAPLASKAGDAEGLASADGNDTTGDLFVSFEGRHRIWRYPFASHGVHAIPVDVALPPRVLQAPNNGGLEGLTRIAAGTLFTVSERYRNGAGNYRAWFLRVPDGETHVLGPSFVAFGAGPGDTPDSHEAAVKPMAPFSMTDVRELPDGDLLTLERRFDNVSGVGIQLRRIPRASVESAAISLVKVPLDGQIVGSFDPTFEIDNMEGLAIRRGPNDETLVYAISDDNFNSPMQSTLLLMYELMP
jgi:hypothetical protein